MSSLFLTQALAIGQGLANGALRHEGRATWLADTFHEGNGAWLPAVSTLAGDLGSGSAGVALFLAHLAAVGPAGAPLGEVAGEALRHALNLGEGLNSAGRLGWYRGSLGVAWAAMTAGRLLARDDLAEDGARLAERAVAAARHHAPDPADTALLGGAADLVAGLLAIGPLLDGDAATEVADDQARRLATALAAAHERQADTAEAAPVGLARGASGPALLLAAWAGRGGHPEGSRVADRAFAAERACFEPGAGWWAPAAHAWATEPGDLTRSWCSGAAGIGIARLVGHRESGETLLLAEVGAAIELVRGGATRLEASDASVCHGACGELELLLLAAELLAEPTHREAARRAGVALVESARVGGGFGSGLGRGMRSPGLLFGLAGTGLTLLRLYDPRAAPSPALPPVLAPRSDEQELARR